MKTIALDVHAEWSQLAAYTENGTPLLELKVATKAEDLQRIVRGIPGPKRVVFEEGPLSGLIHDALVGEADEIISSNPTFNALIARAEDANDENDARRLAILSRAGALRGVYVPPEPFRTWRGLVQYDYSMAQATTMLKNRIKGLCRRQGIPQRGVQLYRAANRKALLKQITQPQACWHMESLCRRLDALRVERVSLHRVMGAMSRSVSVVKRLQTIPGFGALTARTVVAWIVDPLRFKSRNAMSSYAGLGLGQGFTNWKPIAPTRASKRGQRALKRVLFIAARTAIRGENALARRYMARLQAGWSERKAIRDIARTMLFIVRSIWITGEEYQDERITVPVANTR